MTWMLIVLSAIAVQRTAPTGIPTPKPPPPPLTELKGAWVVLRLQPSEPGRPGEAHVARVVDLHVRNVTAGEVLGIRPGLGEFGGPEPATIRLEYVDEVTVECVDTGRGPVRRTFKMVDPRDPRAEDGLHLIREIRAGTRRFVVDARFGLHDFEHYDRPGLRRLLLVANFEVNRKATTEERVNRLTVRREEGASKESARVEAIGPRSKRLIAESLLRAPVTVVNETEEPVLFIPTSIHDDEGKPVAVAPVHSSVSSLVDVFRGGRFWLAFFTGTLEMTPAIVLPGRRADLIGAGGQPAVTSKVVFTTENRWGRVYDRVRTHDDFTVPFVITVEPGDVHERVSVELGEWDIEPDADYRRVREPAGVRASDGTEFEVEELEAAVTGELTHDEASKAMSTLLGGTTYRFIPGEPESVEQFHRKGGATASARLRNPTREPRAVRFELEFTGSNSLVSRPFTRAKFDLVLNAGCETMLRVRIDPPVRLSGPINEPPYTIDLRDRALK